MRVYWRRAEVEARAWELLREYQRRCGGDLAPPIDVDLVGELARGLTFDLLRKVAASQESVLGEVGQALTSLGGRFDYLLGAVLEQLGRHGTPETEVLVEVNVAGEAGKSGIARGELPSFLDRCPVRVVGLMTMPPLAPDPEDSRRHFAALRELAGEHGLPHLSMWTSQDYLVAVEEGATIIRLGTGLYRGGAS